MAAKEKTTGRNQMTAADRQRKSRGANDETITVSLRLPRHMLTEIDRLVKARPFRTPRHLWLLEAIHEKIARDHQASR